MTKEEWKQAEEALKSFFSPVRLKIDGYDVTLILERVDTYHNAIMIYIGNKIRLEWMDTDCEERRRFYQKKVRSLLTAKQKANLKKLSKKRQKEFAESYHIDYEFYMPQWQSFGALKKHLIANNENIELVKIG